MQFVSDVQNIWILCTHKKENIKKWREILLTNAEIKRDHFKRNIMKTMYMICALMATWQRHRIVLIMKVPEIHLSLSRCVCVHFLSSHDSSTKQNPIATVNSPLSESLNEFAWYSSVRCSHVLKIQFKLFAHYTEICAKSTYPIVSWIGIVLSICVSAPNHQQQQHTRVRR